MAPHYVSCPNCNEKRDIGGDYTSPANRLRDAEKWHEAHLSGACALARAAAPEDVEPSPEHRFNTLKDRLTTATGSPGLTSFHGGKVHMTLGEWERLIDTICESQAQQITTAQVTQALNKAADEIIDVAENDERITDTVNLMTNSSLHFLVDPDADLGDAIEASYDEEDPEDVLDWIR